MRGRLAVIALGMALALPALPAPFAIDDIYMFAVRAGATPVALRWWDLYSFAPGTRARNQALIASGALPWWSAPDLHVAFFRPASSALVALDQALFGHNPLGGHVHSLLWWAALLAVVAALYRRVLAGGVALLALFLFAIDDSHWMPIVWAAARNGLVATVPSLLGLVAHLRWREQGLRAGAVLGPVGFAVGLAGGEAAIGVLAYVVAFEVVGRAHDSAGTRAVALAPYAGLLALYAAARAAAGAGVAHTGSYIDPAGDPLRFAQAALARLPALAGDSIFGVPVELWGMDARARPFLVIAGVVGLALVAWWLRCALARLRPDEARPVRWLAGGALLAVVPGTAALLGGRLLLPSSIGAAAVLAVLLRDGLRRWREGPGQEGAKRARRARRALVVLAGGALALPNVVLAAPLLVGKIVLWGTIAGQTRRLVCQAPLDGGGPTRAVVVWADQPIFAQFGGAIRWFHCPARARSWTVLSMSPSAQQWSRPAPNELVVSALAEPLLGTEWEQTFRAAGDPMQPGQVVTQSGGLEITVQAVRGGRPTRVSFRFPEPPEKGDFRLLLWQKEQVGLMELPPVGGSVVLEKK